MWDAFLRKETGTHIDCPIPSMVTFADKPTGIKISEWRDYPKWTREHSEEAAKQKENNYGGILK